MRKMRRFLSVLLVLITLLSGSRVFAQLPANPLVGYLQNWSNLKLSQAHANYNVLCLAFALPVGYPTPGYNLQFALPPGYSSVAQLQADIDLMHSQGKVVLLSIGGATGPIMLNDASQQTAFVNSINNIFATYGNKIDGIDMDLEQSGSMGFGSSWTISSPDARQTRMVNAIKSIMATYQTTNGKKMILTMAPEVVYLMGGLSTWQVANVNGGAFLPILDGLRNELDLLHMQLYNAGGATGGIYAWDGNLYYDNGGPDFMLAMNESIIKGFTCVSGKGTFTGIPASKIAFGFPATSSSSSAGTGYVAPATICNAVKYFRGQISKPAGVNYTVTTSYPAMRGLMTWSINEDYAGSPSWNFASNFTCAFSGTAPVANFTNTPSAGCTGQTVTFTDASTNTPTSWSWNFGSGASPATATTQGPHNVTYSSTGTKTVTLTATNAFGNNTSTKNITVTTVPANAGTISGTATVCSGSTGNVYSITSVSGATGYTWSVPTGATITAGANTASITVTFGSTSGNVSVRPSNACGNSAAATNLAVTVNTAPATPGAISGTTSICSGSGNTYSISSVSGASSYTWTLPSGWTGTSTTTSINTTASATSGNISVVANSVSCGSSASSSQAITVNATPATPGSISGPTGVCPSSSNNYSVATVAGATSYVWTLPSGWSGSSTTNTISATSTGSGGTITVRASNSCGTSATQTQALTISSGAGNAGTITGLATACSGTTGNVYSIASVSGASGYNWSLPSGASITAGTNTNSITVTMGSGSGTISVTPTSSCGNGTPSSLSVTVNAVPAIPGTISGTTSVCSGSSNTYSISAVSGASSYTWTLPSGWSGSSTTTSISTTASATSGTISVVANSTSCGSSAPRTLAVTASAIPATPGTISGLNSVCPSSANTYSISTVAGASSYTWTLPSGWTGSSATNSISATSTSSGGTISVAAVNSCGTSSFSSMSVAIGGGLSVSGSTQCAAGNANLQVLTAGGPYQWYAASTGGPALYTGATYTPSVSATTTYYVEQSSVTNGQVGMTTAPAVDYQIYDNIAGTRTFPTNANTMLFTTSIDNVTINSVDIYTGAGSQAYISDFWVTIENNASTVLYTSPHYTITSSWPTANPKFKTVVLNGLLATAGTYKMRIYSTAQADAWGIVATGQSLPVSSSGTIVTLSSGYNAFTNVKFQYGSGGSSCGRTPVTAVVGTPAVASVSISASATTICSGASVTFTAAPINGGTAPSYQWKVGTTNVGTNSATYTTTGLANGNAVTCIMTSNAACATSSPATSNAVTMTVNSNVTAGVSISTGSTTVCSGASVVFTATPTNGGASPSYQWKVGSTNVGSNSPGFTTSTLNNGDVVTCSMTSNASCVTASPATSNALTMTVSPNALAGVSISASATSICSGTSVTFTATPLNGGTPSYQWKVGSTNVGTNSATYTTTGLSHGNIVTCVMTSSLPCSGSPATSNAVTMTVTPNVTAGVSISASSTAICAGTSVTFTATPTNGGASPSYQWKVGSTNVGSNAATYTTTGLANGDVVTCVMTSNATCVTASPATSNAVTMTVSGTLIPAVSVSASATTICAGTNVTFTATPTNGGASPSYQWKVGSTNVGSNSASYSSTTLNHGDVVSVVMTSSATCASPATAASSGTTMTVNSNVTPSVSVSASATTICAGTSVIFTATPANGGTPSYQWKVGSVNVGSNAPTFTSSTLANGDVVSVVMTSTATCASPATATSSGTTMTVNPVLAPSVSVSASQTSICSGTSVTFTATPTNGGTPSYQWKVGSANVGSNSSTYTSGTLADGDVVSVVMTSNAACASATTATSTTTTMSVVTTANASVSISASSSSSCDGDLMTFTAAPVNGGAPSYQWRVNSINEGTNSNTFSSSTLNDGDIVECIMISSLSCVSGSPAFSNTIAADVIPSGTHPCTSPSVGAISGPVSVNPNQTGVTYSVANEPNTTFSWSIPSGAVIVSGQGTNTVTVDFGTSGGTIQVVATNAHGSTTVSQTVGIINSINGNVYSNSISVYPTPFMENVFVKINSDRNQLVTLKIIDAKGRVVYESQEHHTNQEIILGDQFGIGIYVISAVVGDHTMMYKIIKQ